LGPLFFLIFINDLPFIMELLSKLFADDTTFYDANIDIQVLISSFRRKLEPLLEWCKFNRVDINFKKTYFVVITRKHIIMPETIKFNNVDIEVVSSFKLLGVTIDNKLTFSKYISMTCGRINGVLHSIKRLFFLPLATKVQFFKTFILPLFDYCLSLSIYYAKYIIAKLSNCYYITMAKLFSSNRSDKFNFSNKSFDEIQSFLANYKLFSFSHRVFIRLDLFIFKIVNSNCPPYLSEKLKTIGDDNIANNLRSNYMQQETQSKDHSKDMIRKSDHFDTIYVNRKNHVFGEKTFDHFGALFFNSFMASNKINKLLEFKQYLYKNLGILHHLFLDKFPKFKNFFNFTTKKIPLLL